ARATSSIAWPIICDLPGGPRLPPFAPSSWPSSWNDRVKIDLSGQKAIVTGSTTGIGLAIAKGLAGAGADVIVNGRRQDVTDGVVAELTALCPDVTIEGV